jgi:hypothetical protein
MRHSASTLQRFSASKRFFAHGDAIEWEELPSLADSLAERLINDHARRRGAGLFDGSQVAAWDNTMPADLLSITPTQPFNETLSGLATREVHEPEVFRHFFGASLSA